MELPRAAGLRPRGRGSRGGRGRGRGSSSGSAPSASSYEARPTLPAGPSSLEDLINWPIALVKTVDKHFDNMKGHLGSLFDGRLYLHTDYSGKMGPEVGLAMMIRALKKEFDLDLSDKLKKHRTCDSSRMCQDLALQAARRGHGPDHVFGALQSRLPEERRLELEAMRPEKEASVEAAAVRYGQMQTFLEDHAGEIFTGALDRCLVHDDYCPVWHECAEGEISVSVAGAMCTPWCKIGANLRLADPATEPWHVWCTEQSQILPDIVVLENSDMFDKTAFFPKLEHTHTNVMIRFCATDRGAHSKLTYLDT